VLDSVVDHAAHLVPAQWAVALVADRITTVPARLVASTDRAVTDVVSRVSGRAGAGPGWWAFEHAAVCVVPDLASEVRFGSYAPELLRRTPIRSVLAVPLVGAGDVLGVLTLYADRVDAFGVEEVERAGTVASVAGVALAAADAEGRAANLEVALSNSRTIGMALGVLAERHGLSEDQAFEVLRRCSMRGNRKLADLARELLHCRELPELTDALHGFDSLPDHTDRSALPGPVLAQD
jgi:GAF domain-containing protein